MRIAIVGATGRTGKVLLGRAKEAGHRVTVLARDPAKLGDLAQNVRVIKGDVTDPEAIVALLAEADAVLSTLGHVKGSPPDLQAAAMMRLIPAMRARHIRRLVVLTGGGVVDPADHPKVIDRVITSLLHLTAPEVIRDAEHQAELVRASELDWVIVRGPRLVEGDFTGKYRIGFVGKDSGVRATLPDIADFMLRCLTDTTYLHHAPLISS